MTSSESKTPTMLFGVSLIASLICVAFAAGSLTGFRAGRIAEQDRRPNPPIIIREQIGPDSAIGETIHFPILMCPADGDCLPPREIAVQRRRRSRRNRKRAPHAISDATVWPEIVGASIAPQIKEPVGVDEVRATVRDCDAKYWKPNKTDVFPLNCAISAFDLADRYYEAHRYIFAVDSPNP